MPSPRGDFVLETSGYYALAAPVALSLIVGEAALCHLRGAEHSGLQRSLGSLNCGLGAMLMGLILAPLIIGAYVFAYENLAFFHWEPGSPIPWILALVVGDLCYYLDHRASHGVAALWAVHGVHHQSESFDYTVASRHPWIADLHAIPFYAPLPLLGVPPGHFFVMISLISFYAFFMHTRTYDFPSFGVLVTPRSHIVHHCRNVPYIGHNFGAMFNVWDRLFSTHTALDSTIEPQLGTPEGYRTHDAVLAQWVGVRDVAARVARAPTWFARLYAVLGPPALPEGHVPPRPLEVTSPATDLYLTLQFIIVWCIAAVALWGRHLLEPGVIVTLATIAMFGLATLGAVLDSRPRAWRWEAGRIVCTGGLLLVGFSAV